MRVIVGGRENSAGSGRAAAAGIQVHTLPEATANADLVILALPDEVQRQVYREAIAPSLRSGSVVGFLHGFAVCYGLIQAAAEVGVVMIAPKGPGATLRDRFVEGTGIPCLLAVKQDSPARDAEGVALAWAAGIGCARAGIIYTTFEAETETDLFGEQAVLCGGMTSLILAAFETLVDAGYPPELAYLECCHEVKQVADLVYERGLAGAMKAISNTAEFGTYLSGPRVIDPAVRSRLEELLAEIRNGSFARQVRDDFEAGFPWFREKREELATHPIEDAGRTIRSLMGKNEQ